ncbi:MAG: response regulator transcription factor [Oscillospiraceae bacterium]|nr:response regulator transcription factor [Oscillospiraceae bacterium]
MERQNVTADKRFDSQLQNRFTILLVEDNKTIQEANKELFEEIGGYNVHLAMTLAEARQSVAAAPPDLIVLDIMLPDGCGLDFLKELREQKSPIHVLLLTALSETSHEAKGLLAGGDDYIAKPYDNDMLLIRAGALLRRSKQTGEMVKEAVAQAKAEIVNTAAILEYGYLTINHTTAKAYLYGKDTGLTPKEFSLLAYFLKNTDKKLTANEIYESIWGDSSLGSSDVVRAHIKNLRKKLKTDDEVAIAIDTVGRKYYVCRIVVN